jgi:hypothetical protein
MHTTQKPRRDSLVRPRVARMLRSLNALCKKGGYSGNGVSKSSRKISIEQSYGPSGIRMSLAVSSPLTYFSSA